MSAVLLRSPILRPLGDRALALLWAGLATSAIGDQLFTVALSWVAAATLGADAGYLNALRPVTILAVALLAGQVADRLEPRRLMILADLGRAAVLLALVLVWLRAGVPPEWSLIGAVVALAAGYTLFRPALQASIPPLVPDRSWLPATNALLDTTDRIARLIGPGIVGLLSGVLPLVHFVTLGVVTLLASAASVATIRRWRPIAAPAPAARESFVRSIGRGFRAMRAHRILGYFLLVNTGPLTGIWWAAMFLAVPLILGATPGGLSAFGFVLASYGSTNLLATLVFGGRAVPRRPAWMVFGADMVMGLGIGTMGLAVMLLPVAWIPAGMCAGAAVAAIGGPMSDIPTAVLRQTRLALADQAAAMRAWLMAMNFGILLCLGIAPSVFGWIGPARALMCGGLIMLALGAIGLARHWRTEG